MSLMRFYYDPFSDTDRLFDDVFSSRMYRPVAPSTETRRDLFRPRYVVYNPYLSC